MLWRDLKVWQIWGANTDVGKSVVSTVLCKALRHRAQADQIFYLKPIQTGLEADSDASKVAKNARGVFTKCLFRYATPKSPHVAARGYVSSIPPFTNLV